MNAQRTQPGFRCPGTVTRASTMATLTERRKWIGILGGTLLAAAVAIYLFSFNVFGPSPTQARTALANAGLCSPDASISERDGKTIIGDYECDLRGAGSTFPYRCLVPDGEPGRFDRVRLGVWKAIPSRPITGPVIK